MPDARIPVSKCPVCGYGPMDAAMSVTEKSAVPSVGDSSVCLKCGSMLAFGDDLKLRRATIEDVESVIETKMLLVWHKAHRLIVEQMPCGVCGHLMNEHRLDGTCSHVWADGIGCWCEGHPGPGLVGDESDRSS